MKEFGTTVVGRIAVWCAALGVACSASADVDLGGRVRDPLGRALDRVEVFLVPEGNSSLTSLAAATDAMGRFVIPAVPLGLYRVAAVKNGYGVYLGRVNTALRSSLEVVLHPLPLPGDPRLEVVPDDPSWALRLPRRSVWQENAPEPPGAIAQADGAPERPRSLDDGQAAFELGGVIDQSFALAATDPKTWAGGFQGQETRLGLSGAMGQTANLRLDGYRRSAAAAAALTDELAPQGGTALAAAGVALGMTYRGAPDSAFDVGAYYSRSAFDPDAASSVGESGASWGAKAAWSMQVDPTSKFDLRMDYGQSSFGAEPGVAAPQAESRPGPTTALEGRWLGAAGVYETVPANGHQVSLGFRAQFAHLPIPVFVPAPFSRPADPQSEGGWSLHLHAEDSWAVTAPVTLTYGIGYRQRIAAEQDVAVLIPRFGAVWTAERVQLRGAVSYHTLTVADPAAGRNTIAGRPDRSGALGYDVGIDAGLSPTVRLRGAVSYAPMQELELGYERSLDALGARPLYLTDGQAEVFEASTGMARDVGPTTAYLEAARGRVEGLVAAVLPFDTPVQSLTPAELQYRSVRFGVRVAASGTDVRVEHRRVLESSTSAPPSERDDLALRVVQDLLTNAGGAAWRLLLAVQSTDLGTGSYALARVGGMTYRLPASHYQVNAGMSIAF